MKETWEISRMYLDGIPKHINYSKFHIQVFHRMSYVPSEDNVNGL